MMCHQVASLTCNLKFTKQANFEHKFKNNYANKAAKMLFKLKYDKNRIS